MSDLTMQQQWQTAFEQLPLIAILRGICTDEAIQVTSVLVDAGFTIIEVPLNSPSPLDTIQVVSQEFGDQIVMGAGTVLSADQASEVHAAGGRLIVAPNFSQQVARVAGINHSIYCPGVATPTEAFNALEAGAAALKLFPAELITPPVVKAMRAVLPGDALLLPVGGITPANMADYMNAGANGFGIGSALYKPGVSLVTLKERAEGFVSAYNETKGQG